MSQKIIRMEKNRMRTLFSRPAIVVSTYIGLCLWSSLSLAQNPDASNLYKRSLAATCANCHGTDGIGGVDGNIPLINNLTHAQILEKLMAYKSGLLEGTIMPQLTKGYTEEQLNTIANQLGKN